jgi:hypothetical protein
VAKAAHHCFCFFIDGLDEFNAASSDIAELVAFFFKLSESRRVKIVLSNRPLQIFEDTMSRSPKLRVQDLTYDDISVYVNDKMHGHPRMRRLMAKQRDAADALALELVSASSGVFLWVSLVVISLLEGLDNSDDIEDLRLRLRELPRELNDLYSVMLNRVPARYRHQTARLLQLVYFGTQDSMPLSALGLWYASELRYYELLETEISPLTKEEEEEALEDLERRVKSRCFGMIEILVSERRAVFDECLPSPRPQLPRYEPYSCDSASQVPTVRFIHRSVSEFLQQKEIWDQYLQYQAEDAFQPNISLVMSVILCIKKLRFTNSHEGVDTLRDIILHAAYRIRQAEI